MGAVTLEGRLRSRLALLLAPTLAALAVAAVFVTSRALDAVDNEHARALSAGIAHAIEAEVGEGDSRAEAQREALSTIDVRVYRIAIRDGPSVGAMAGELAALPPGSCHTVRNSEGAWRGCAVAAGPEVIVAAVQVDAHARVVRELGEWMAVAVGFVLMVAFGASRLAIRTPLASVRALATWARGVTRGEDARPPRDETIELGDLADAFERLVSELTAALDRERAQSAHIAHELRTPLTTIIAELHAMPSSSGDAVARLREDAARLARVIDAILLLSAPASHRATVVVNVADLARRLAPAGATVNAPDEALVEAEAELVELAVQNLVENATKHAPGMATLTVQREANSVRIAVVDRGRGLDADGRRRMFDRFWRESETGGGTGLGLALVRAVAERHGGIADARAPGEGRGLDVGFSMGPLLAWHDTAAEPLS
jgi:signal transduction histidine kinase